MKERRFTEGQIAFALKLAETGTPVAKVLRRMGISKQACLMLEDAARRLGDGRTAAAEAARG